MENEAKKRGCSLLDYAEECLLDEYQLKERLGAVMKEIAEKITEKDYDQKLS